MTILLFFLFSLAALFWEVKSNNYLFACALPEVSQQTIINVFGQRLTERYVAPQSYIMLSCHSGFSVRNGDTKGFCFDDGTWSTIFGTCLRNTSAPNAFATVTPRPRPPKCIVPLVRNGYLIADRYRAPFPLMNFDVESGTHITLSCDPGFMADGADEADCMNSGTWSTRIGRCILRPPENTLPAITDTCDVPNVCNGAVSINNGPDIEGDGFIAPVYARIELKCKQGYVLVGQDKAVCLCKDEWSNSLGKCVEPQASTPSPVWCRLPDIDNGKFLTVTGDAISGEYVVNRMIVVLCCDVGYVVAGVDRSTCTNAQFSPSFGFCRPIWRPLPVTGPRITMTTPAATTTTSRFPQCRLSREQYGRFFTPEGEMIVVDVVAAETAVVLRCNPGYSPVRGSRSAVCIWGEFTPILATCVLINGGCQAPDIFHGRVVNASDKRQVQANAVIPDGGLVMLDCDPGYTVQGGEARAYCSNSLWIPNNLGACRPPPTTTTPAGTTRSPSCVLPIKPNGKFVSSEYQDILSVAVISGMMAILKCNLGFEVWPRTREKAFCNGYDWSQEFGDCKPIQTGEPECGRPEMKYKSLDLVNHARVGNATAIGFLLQAGAHPDSQDQNGWSALMWAANNNFTNVMSKLIHCGASVDLKNPSGSTALLFAAKAGNLLPVRLLLDSGANPNVTNSFGSTALAFAAQNSANDVLKTLLFKGVELEAKDNDGATALLWASRGNYTETVQLLLIAGANPNTSNEDKVTPLMVASRGGYLQVAWVLLDRGADPNLKDLEGNSAVSLADEYGQSEVADLLIRRGATRGMTTAAPRLAMINFG